MSVTYDFGLQKPIYPYKSEEAWVPLANLAPHWVKNFHDLLLNDKVRMAKYKEAVFSAIETLIERSKGKNEIIKIMDVGTGTGILSYWAALAWKTLIEKERADVTVKIYAIEADPKIAALAKLILGQELGKKGIRNDIIKIIPKSSYEIEPEDLEKDSPYNCIDLIMSEILGNIADSEDMIGILSQVKSKFLKPEGVMIPGRVEQYFVPVMSSNLHTQIKSGKIKSIDDIYRDILFENLPEEDRFNISYDAIIPPHLHLSEVRTKDDIISWNFVIDEELTLEYSRSKKFNVLKEDAMLHGFKGFFRAYLTETIILDLSPDNCNYNIPDINYIDDLEEFDYSKRIVCDCWKHSFLPIKNPIKVNINDTITFNFSRKLDQSLQFFSYRWWGYVGSKKFDQQETLKRPHVIPINDHKIHFRTLKSNLIQHEYDLKGEFLIDKDIVIDKTKKFLNPDIDERYKSKFFDNRLKNLLVSFPLSKKDIRENSFAWLNNEGKELSNNPLPDNSWIIYYALKDKSEPWSSFLSIKYVSLSDYKVFLSSLKSDDDGTYLLCLMMIPPHVMSQFSPSEISDICMFFLLFQEQIILAIIERRSIKHGLQASLSAIMSRNLSHNIGSHVLSYWSKELSSILTEGESRKSQLYPMFENLSKVIGEKMHAVEQNKIDTLMNFLEDSIGSESKYTREQEALQKSEELFQYLQSRMDFIAEITTSLPSSFVSLDLKNDILLPVLNPWLDRFKQDNGSKYSALLQYITKSEGIDLHDKIEIDLRETDECRFASIASGLVGIHAIYSIFENYIRNAAKHYKNAKGDPGFKIVIKNPENEIWKKNFITVELWDMRENSCDFKIVEKLRDFLPGGKGFDFFISDRLNPDGWGLKEMIICANFLRGTPPEALLEKNVKKDEPELLEILCNTSCKNDCKNIKCCHPKEFKNKLGMRLHLLKPKDLGVVIESPKKGDKEKSIFSIEQISRTGLSDKKSTIPHQMLLVGSQKLKKEYEEKTHLPLRVMVYNNRSKIDDDYYLELYEDFIKREVCQNPENSLPKIKYSDDGWTYETSLDKYVCNTPWKELLSNTNTFLKDLLVFRYHLNEELKEDSGQSRRIFNESLYLQPISASYTSKAKLDNLPQNSKLKKLFCLALIESAVTKIVIVDERVSEWAHSNWYSFEKRHKTVKEILSKMNIFTVDLNTKQVDFGDISKKLLEKKAEFNVFNENINENAHFFVIHQGILDKLGEKAERFMNAIKCRWKIINSGRGVPKTLLKDVRFIQISALQRTLENFDKHGLTQILFSSRRPRIE